MSYKVFLVEDEIVAREGIRDNVDWKSAGFEFCGEAPDGEIALLCWQFWASVLEIGYWVDLEQG